MNYWRNSNQTSTRSQRSKSNNATADAMDLDNGVDSHALKEKVEKLEKQQLDDAKRISDMHQTIQYYEAQAYRLKQERDKSLYQVMQLQSSLESKKVEKLQKELESERIKLRQSIREREEVERKFQSAKTHVSKLNCEKHKLQEALNEYFQKGRMTIVLEKFLQFLGIGRPSHEIKLHELQQEKEELSAKLRNAEEINNGLLSRMESLQCDLHTAKDDARQAIGEKQEFFKMLDTAIVKRNDATTNGCFPNGSALVGLVEKHRDEFSDYFLDLVDLSKTCSDFPMSLDAGNPKFIFDNVLVPAFNCVQKKYMIILDSKTRQLKNFIEQEDIDTFVSNELARLFVMSNMQRIVGSGSSKKNFDIASENNMVFHDKFLKWALSGRVKDHKHMNGTNLNQIMGVLLDIYLKCHYSDPHCHLWPEIGSIVSYSPSEHSQLSFPSCNGRAKAGMKVHVLFPGLYYEPVPADNKMVEPIVKAYVVLFPSKNTVKNKFTTSTARSEKRERDELSLLSSSSSSPVLSSYASGNVTEQTKASKEQNKDAYDWAGKSQNSVAPRTATAYETESRISTNNYQEVEVQHLHHIKGAQEDDSWVYPKHNTKKGKSYQDAIEVDSPKVDPEGNQSHLSHYRPSY